MTIDDDEPTRLFTCAGPPVCDLDGDAAVTAMKAGCPWCQVETYQDGDLIHTTAPTHQ